MLESFRDSSDPTVAAFATFVKHEIDKVSNKVYKIDLEYQKELAPLVTESERLNPASLTEKITFKEINTAESTVETIPVIIGIDGGNPNSTVPNPSLQDLTLLDGGNINGN